MEIRHVYRTPIAYKVATVGVVGRDPEVKYLPNGQAVATFSITNHIDSRGFATTSGVLKRFDVNAEVANEVAVIGWLAGVCSKYLGKGREVHITGQLQTRRNADGERQRVIVAEGIYFVGAPRQTGLGEDVARGDKVVTRWLSEYGPGARR
jgi:single-strand DNA-binding protein